MENQVDKIVAQRAQQWLDGEYDEQTKAAVRKMMAEDPKELTESFYQTLEFGTGGLRGIMGVGTNRMNIYTVGMATQGLANYLKKSFPGQEIKVAVAHDCRNNSDLFAKTTADVFAANGFTVYLFDALRPTPELSFAIRHLGCMSGVVVTASHNPKEYNGYKAYWNDGAQVIAPHDTNIIDEVNKISDISQVKYSGGDGKIITVGEEVDKAYLDMIAALSLSPEAVKAEKDMKIVYTPIHGTGVRLVPASLKRYGFENVIHVPEQDVNDGNFPTVVSPNPEEPSALKLALAKADETGADLVIATDPDADRLGIYAKDGNGKYVPFTGNMTGILIAEYQLSQKRAKGLLPVHSEDAAIVTTIVSTDMAAAVAKEYGVTCIEVLTGFKYIGEKIKLFESAKEKNGGKYCARCGAFDFIFGFEESYGCLLGTHARDKDAVAAVAALAEAAAFYAERGISLPEAADNLFRKYGYYKEALVSKVLKGADGAGKIRQITENLRNNPAKQIGSEKVVRVRDYLKNTVTDTDTGAVETTGLPQSDVMYFELEGGWCCIRPSGTEPKIKLYMGVVCETEQAAIKRLEILKDSLTEMLGL